MDKEYFQAEGDLLCSQEINENEKRIDALFALHDKLRDDSMKILTTIDEIYGQTKALLSDPVSDSSLARLKDLADQRKRAFSRMNEIMNVQNSIQEEVGFLWESQQLH